VATPSQLIRQLLKSNGSMAPRGMLRECPANQTTQRGGARPCLQGIPDHQVLTVYFRGVGLKFAEGWGKNASQGVGTPAGKQKAEGEQELRESVLHTIVREVETVRKMDEEDRTGHHDHDANSTNTDKGAREQSESTRELRQTYQEADENRGVHVARKTMNAGAPKDAKENGAAVVEKDECTGDAEDEQGEIEFTGSRRGQCGRSHRNLLSIGELREI
jgi:hypothetical protein